MRWLRENWMSLVGWAFQLLVTALLIGFAWSIGYDSGAEYTIKVLHWCGKCP